MKEIYIIRHGQTNSNIKGTYCGITDHDLNEVGRKQVEKLKKKLDKIISDIIYQSPLKRAMSTAMIIMGENNKIEIETDYRLMERNFGIFEDLTYSEIKEKYKNEHDKLILNPDGYIIPSGESCIQHREKVHRFVDEKIKESKYERIFIITHGGTARILIAYLLELEIKNEWRFYIDNAKLSKIEINIGKYAILKSLNA